MNGLLAGIDIGGTKCAVSLGISNGAEILIQANQRFVTPSTPDSAIAKLTATLRELLAAQDQPLSAIGISCGGPLDSRRGIVLSPPNLPGWDEVPIVARFRDAFGVPTTLQNDANAGALAEWLWGAGKGCQNLIFLTFGTGMGAGLILDGRLYSGTNDMAGEVGHIRLTETGPIGYGKAGSFEGWCSGGGIQRLAVTKAEAAIRAGNPPSFCPTLDDLPLITTERVAKSDDPLARGIFQTVGRRLGRGLAILIDVLNPQRIVIGSIFLRQRELLEAPMYAVLREEALSYALDVCEIVPAGLGESIGDYAALAVALYGAGDD
ncbi:MAG: ROK family protein [Anaerolineae bacterium]|nr:ROK family protein [Anaerolineae bacterium]